MTNNKRRNWYYCCYHFAGLLFSNFFVLFVTIGQKCQTLGQNVTLFLLWQIIMECHLCQSSPPHTRSHSLTHSPPALTLAIIVLSIFKRNFLSLHSQHLFSHCWQSYGNVPLISWHHLFLQIMDVIDSCLENFTRYSVSCHNYVLLPRLLLSKRRQWII